MDSLDDTLAHFGIKGMRWGVRRSRDSSGHVSKSSSSSHLSEDAAKAKESHAIIKKHGSTDPLSNKDLQHLVSRIDLEQRYSRLTSSKNNVAKVKKGHGVIKEILGVGDTAKKTYDLVKSPMVKDISKAFSNAKTKRAVSGHALNVARQLS